MFLKELINEVFSIQYDWGAPYELAHFRDTQYKLV